MNKLEYDRLLKLKNLINSNKATKDHKKEYMRILVKNRNITNDQYQKFLANENSDAIINAALTIGGVMLAFYLISELTKD